MSLYPYRLTIEEIDEAKRLRDATAEERVEFLYEMMLNARFVRGRTARRLAPIWGLTLSTVNSYSTRAADKLRTMEKVSGVTAEEKREELRQRFDAINRRALAKKKAVVVRDKEGSYIEMVDDPDLEVVSKNIMRESEMYGLGSHRIGAPQANVYVGLSQQQIVERYEAAQKKLEEEGAGEHESLPGAMAASEAASILGIGDTVHEGGEEPCEIPVDGRPDGTRPHHQPGGETHHLDGGGGSASGREPAGGEGEEGDDQAGDEGEEIGR